MEDYVLKIPQLEIVGKCSNALSALQILNSRQIDILFLDIQMPDLTGIELIKIVKNKPAIILTTAYSEHALEGYRLDITDYLLKPIPFERFVQAANKAIEWCNFKNFNPALPTQNNTTQNLPDHFFVKSDYKQVKIFFSDILYIEGLREYVSIFTSEKRIITLETLKNMELLLAEQNFIRIHKSYIINKSKVNAINGNMVELGKQKIPIGKSYKSEVLQLLKIK